jgi:hypothetical protein
MINPATRLFPDLSRHVLQIPELIPVVETRWYYDAGANFVQRPNSSKVVLTLLPFRLETRQ